jgi:hypothetical protein
MFGKHINVITKASRGCLQELWKFISEHNIIDNFLVGGW